MNHAPKLNLSNAVWLHWLRTCLSLGEFVPSQMSHLQRETAAGFGYKAQVKPARSDAHQASQKAICYSLGAGQILFFPSFFLSFLFFFSSG